MRLLLRFDWIIVSFTAIATRFIPFFIYGEHPLGYDTGFYRHYAEQALMSFPNTPSAGLGTTSLLPRLLLNALKIIGIPTDIAIYGLLIGAFACAALSLQYAVKNHTGKKAGFIAGLLFTLSSVQYAGYWFFLLKNYIALSFFFLAFNELGVFLNKEAERKSPLRFIMYASLVFFSHTTTSLMLIGSMTIFWGITTLKKSFKKSDLIIIAITIAIGIIFLLYTGIWHRIDPGTTAIFLEWKEYTPMALPALIFLLFTASRIWKRIIINPFFPPFIVASIFVLFRLPFYERIFLFLDITLIVFCAEGLRALRNDFTDSGRSEKVQILLIVAVFSGWYLGNLSLAIKKYRPLITSTEIIEIKKIDTLTEKDATILTVSDYMPWVYGFTQRNIISPGLLEYKYNLEDWRRFWLEMNEKEKVDFLRVFPKPLYFFTKPYNEDNFITGGCVERKTEYLKKFLCGDSPI